MTPTLPKAANALSNVGKFPQWRAMGIPISDVLKALFYIEDSGSFFIPVQKAACTSIAAAIRKIPTHDSTDATLSSVASWRNPMHVGCVPQDFRSGARLAFTVVRHPVARFWSAYNHLVVQGGDARIGSVVRNSLRLQADRPLTPDLLLRYVESHPVDDLYFAFRPQYAVCGVEMLPIRVAKFENLTGDLAQLVTEGYLPKDFLSYLGKRNNRNSSEVHERHRCLDGKVAEVYGRDLAVFGYC